MGALEYAITDNELKLIHAALKQGCDVRIHPDKYGLKITSEKVRVLSKRQNPEKESQGKD